jgi:hypothetical protein
VGKGCENIVIVNVIEFHACGDQIYVFDSIISTVTDIYTELFLTTAEREYSVI